MRIINKTNTTLIFSDINLVLTYDPEGKGVEIEDLDFKTSESLRSYIDNGKVEVAEKDKSNIMYQRIENRKKLVADSGDKKIKKIGSSDPSSKEESILGGESKIFSSKSKVHTASKNSSIDKFRSTGEMDIKYFGPCFSGETIVVTSNGVKYIKDIKVGDSVLTHTSSWKRVSEVFKTSYNSNLIAVKLGLQNKILLQCTPNHRFLSKDGDWISAESLDGNGSLRIPRITLPDDEKYIKTFELIDVTEDNFPSVCSSNSGILRLSFLYIFGGKSTGSNVEITLTDDAHLRLLEKLYDDFHFYRRGVLVSNEKTVISSVESKNLSSLMINLCGDGDRKIPYFFFRKKASLEFIKMALESKTINKDGSITFYTKHKMVAWGMRTLFLTNGVFSAIQHMGKSGLYGLTAIIREDSILAKSGEINQELINRGNGKPNSYKVDGEGISVCEMGSEAGDVAEFVYNLEVEDDHSYTANFVSAHNCYDAGGYAKMNRKYVLGLNEKENINIHLDNASSRRDIDEDILEKLAECEENSVGEDCPTIHGCTAPVFRCSGSKILYTMMETEQVHPQYIEKCNMANEVWLPSKWCIDKFRESGLKTNVLYMPIGVDFNNYREGKDPLDFGGRVSGFTFISVFGWSLRKCYDIMIRAFVEEFSSADDVTYLICSRFAGGTEEVRKDVCRNEIRNISSGIRKYGRPNIVYFGDVMPEKLMGNLYSSAHCYLGLSRGEGFGLPWCSVAGTKILTPYGYKNIEEIKVGEEVISGAGLVRAVSETHKNKYTGKLVKVNSRLTFNDSEFTGNHKFLAYKPKKIDTSNGGRRVASGFRDVEKWKADWVSAENLTTDHYLVFPKIKRSHSKDLIKFDLLDFVDNKLNVTSDKDTIYSRSSGLSERGLSETADVPVGQAHHQRSDESALDSVRDRVDSAARDIEVSDTKVCLNRYCYLDERLSRLLGYYVAEGSPGENSFSFAFHSKETDYHNEVVQSLMDIFGVDSAIRIRDSKAEIVVYSSILSSFFEKQCGCLPSYKKVPKDIFLSSDSVRSNFLKAYIGGGGRSGGVREETTISTSSIDLAMSYQFLMLEFGVVCSLHKEKRSNQYLCSSTTSLNSIDFSTGESMKFRRKTGSKVFCNEDYLFVPVNNIEHKFVDKIDVYNFDVPDDHSYVANLSVVHNCEASMCGLPVIGSNYSALTDFLNEENSFLVDPECIRPQQGIDWISFYYQGMGVADYGREAINQTRRHMRYVYENYGCAKEKNKKLQNFIKENYDWGICVDRMYDRIKEIYPNLKHRGEK